MWCPRSVHEEQQTGDRAAGEARSGMSCDRNGRDRSRPASPSAGLLTGLPTGQEQSEDVRDRDGRDGTRSSLSGADQDLGRGRSLTRSGQLSAVAASPPLRERLRARRQNSAPLGTQRLARTWLGTPPSPSEEISLPGYTQAVESVMRLDPITGDVTLDAQTRRDACAEISQEILPVDPLVTGRGRSLPRERPPPSEVESYALGSLFRERPPNGDAAIPLRVRVEPLVEQAASSARFYRSAPPPTERYADRQTLHREPTRRSDAELEVRLQQSRTRLSVSGSRVGDRGDYRDSDRPVGASRDPPSGLDRRQRRHPDPMQDEEHESVSQVGKPPAEKPPQATGQGGGATTHENVEQWLRNSDTGRGEPFPTWRRGPTRDAPGLCAPQPRRPDPPPSVVRPFLEREVQSGYRYDLREGLTRPLGASSPMKMGERHHEYGSAFQPYLRKDVESARQAHLAALARLDREPVARPVVPDWDRRICRNEMGGDAPGMDFEPSPSVASSRISCSSSKLLEVVRKAMQAPGMAPLSGPAATTVATEVVPTESRSDTTALKLDGGKSFSDLGKVTSGPVGSAISTTTWVKACSPTPAVTTVVASPALPTPGRALAKARKLRGFSGGKDEAWEVYRTHLEIVRRCNAWDETTTLLHFCSELSGGALEYFSSLGLDERESYDRVMAAMAQRFGSMVNLEAVRGRLEGLRQKADQSIEDLSTQARTLAFAVYAGDVPERREAEAVRCFMRGLSSKDIVQALIQASPIATMTEATDLAIKARELGQAFLQKTKPTAVRRVEAEGPDPDDGTGLGNDDDWDPSSEELMEGIRAIMTGGRGRGRGGRTFARPGYSANAAPTPACWMCGEAKHFARDCPFRPQNWPDWLKKDVTAVAQGRPPTGPPVAQGSLVQSVPQAVYEQPALATAFQQTVQQPAQQPSAPPQGQSVVRAVAATAGQMPVAQQPNNGGHGPPGNQGQGGGKHRGNRGGKWRSRGGGQQNQSAAQNADSAPSQSRTEDSRPTGAQKQQSGNAQ